MSDCPNCGSPRTSEPSDPTLWQCGTQDPGFPTRTCDNVRLKRELRQANAVIDAINTLTENRRTIVEICPSDFDTITVRIKDNTRAWCGKAFGDTLREALEACVEARDQHDREAE